MNRRDFIKALGAITVGTALVRPTTEVETTEVETDEWHHACGVWTSDSERQVYFDNIDKDGNGYKVSSMSLWSVALTEKEVLALSKGMSPLLVRPDGLEAYWPLVST